MSTEYGVNVSNKFAFLDDEGTDPAELLARAAKEKKEKAKLAKETKVAPAPVKPVINNNKDNLENRRPQGNRGPRGPRREGGQELSDRFGERRPQGPRREGGPREDRGPRRDFPPGQRRSGEFKPRPRPDGEQVLDEEGKPVRRFQRRDRDDRGPRRPPRTDRVSGSEKTGVRSVPKKDGHGKGNWGDDNDELVGETEQLKLEENKENGVENVEAIEKPAEEEPAAEPEPPKFTLSEWKAQQKLEKQEFKTRKANEGADQKALQKFVPLKKNDDGEEEDDEEEDGVSLTKRQQSQKTVDIRVSFNDPNRRDFRGPRTNFNNDRRGPRRDGQQNDNRGPRRGPQIDLTHDFPALGAH